MYLCPESPRFLIRKREYAKAFVCLRQLRGTDIQAAKDLYYIHSQLQIETELFHGKPPEQWWRANPYQDEVEEQSFFQRVKSLFTVPRNRRACMAAFLVMLAQQLCGVCIWCHQISPVDLLPSDSPRRSMFFRFIPRRYFKALRTWDRQGLASFFVTGPSQSAMTKLLG